MMRQTQVLRKMVKRSAPSLARWGFRGRTRFVRRIYLVGGIAIGDALGRNNTNITRLS
jgi:hypothetical protein